MTIIIATEVLPVEAIYPDFPDHDQQDDDDIDTYVSILTSPPDFDLHSAWWDHRVRFLKTVFDALPPEHKMNLQTALLTRVFTEEAQIIREASKTQMAQEALRFASAGGTVMVWPRYATSGDDRIASRYPPPGLVWNTVEQRARRLVWPSLGELRQRTWLPSWKEYADGGAGQGVEEA